MSPQAGTIYIAPGGFHMKLIQMGDSIKIDLSLGEPVNFCRPAVDVLFESAAKIYGAFSPAVILTGMGHDGQLGCKALKELGAPIFIQDEATSVVWGMPGAVARAGLDDFCLPIPEIVKKVEKLCP